MIPSFQRTICELGRCDIAWISSNLMHDVYINLIQFMTWMLLQTSLNIRLSFLE